MTLGPSYFDSFANFPEARYIVDVPMAKNDLNNSLLFVKEAYKTIGASNIYAFEISNEPNYPGHVRLEHWSMTDFASQWRNWSDNISKALELSKDSKIYQAIALSSETDVTGLPGGTNTSWNV